MSKVELARAYDALQQADEAGNKEDAQQIADYIRELEAKELKNQETDAQILKDQKFDETLNNPLTYGGMGALSGVIAGPALTKGVDMITPAPLKPGAAPIAGAPTAAPAAPAAGGYQSQHGFHPGATSNAQFNLQQAQANPLAKAGADLPGYHVPGNSRLILPTTINEPTTPVAPEPIPKKLTPKQKATMMMQSKEASPPSRLGQMYGAGMAAGQASDAINQARQGNIGQAAISGVGSVGGAASMSSNPRVRMLGRAVTTAAPILRSITAPEEKAAGGMVGYPGGKAVKGGLEAAKKLFTPKPTKVVRASEALGQHEGKRLGLTQTDNFGVHGGRMGGNQFPNFQNISPKHAEDSVVWMNDSQKHADDMIKRGGDDIVWSTYIGAPDQLKSNKTVFNDILEQHYARDLTPEQFELINKRIATLRPAPNKPLVFPQAFDIRDKFATQELGGDTFSRRAALASMLGEGEGVGRTKNGIALPQYQDILRSHRDPLTEGVPTSSVGTRLFTVDPTKPSKFSQEYHPDYNFPVYGKDLGVQFEKPVPQNLIVPKWYDEYKSRFPNKEPHGNAWFSYMKNPDLITEKMLTNMQKEGFAEGGEVEGYAAGKKVVEAARKLILPPAENAARTQIIGTLPTYEKASNILRQQGASGRGIDFGAGLGEGAKALGKDFDTYEPFAKNWTPTYSNAADVPSDAYGQLTNLNVLNVVPREVRDEIVQDIGRVMQPGGMGIITTRGKDVMNAKGLAGPEPMSVITSRDTYQKGFNKDELEDYLKYMLGDNFEIGRLNLGPAGAMIKKKAEGGLACMKEGGSTPAWQRAEGKNPEGGLNAAGRASYNRETGGNLKAPQPEGGPRKKSFCARMSGMKKKLTSSETANDPDSRINKALRKWKC